MSRRVRQTPPPPAAPPPKSKAKSARKKIDITKADGVDLESERGHEIIDRTIDHCGMMLSRSEIVKLLGTEFNLCVRQAYRYYDHAWLEIRKRRMVDHDVHVDRAVSTLGVIVKMSVKDKQTFAAMQALDRIALLTGIKNPIADQGLNLNNKVEDDLSDAELQAIVSRRAKRAGAGGGSSRPAPAPTPSETKPS